MRSSTPFRHMRINMLYVIFPASKGLYYVKLFSVYQNEQNPSSRVSTYIISSISTSPVSSPDASFEGTLDASDVHAESSLSQPRSGLRAPSGVSFT